MCVGIHSAWGDFGCFDSFLCQKPSSERKQKLGVTIWSHNSGNQSAVCWPTQIYVDSRGSLIPDCKLQEGNKPWFNQAFWALALYARSPTQRDKELMVEAPQVSDWCVVVKTQQWEIFGWDVFCIWRDKMFVFHLWFIHPVEFFWWGHNLMNVDFVLKIKSLVSNRETHNRWSFPMYLHFGCFSHVQNVSLAHFCICSTITEPDQQE